MADKYNEAETDELRFRNLCSCTEASVGQLDTLIQTTERHPLKASRLYEGDWGCLRKAALSHCTAAVHARAAFKRLYDAALFAPFVYSGTSTYRRSGTNSGWSRRKRNRPRSEASLTPEPLPSGNEPVGRRRAESFLLLSSRVYFRTLQLRSRRQVEFEERRQ